MLKIRSRKQLREYILQELGAPVINVELDDVQIDNAINKAISYFIDFHSDGVEEVLLVFNIDDFTRQQGYVTLDDSIVGVQSILNSNTSTGGGEELENIDHLIANSDLFKEGGLALGGLEGYVRSRQTIENLRYFLNSFYDFEYNKVTNRLHFKNDLTNVSQLGIVVYQSIDPYLDFDIFNDEWIKKYATAQAMYTWGFLLSKYTGMELAGQGQVNGELIMNEGKEQIATYLEEFQDTYNTPPLPRVE